MNNVQLIGRLTRDVELKYSASNVGLARFTVAVDKGLSKEKKAEFEAQGKPTADFIPCVCFNKRAEMASQYLKKGARVGITGNIVTGSYQRQDGTTAYTVEVQVFNFDMIDWPQNNNQQVNQNRQNNMSGQGGYNPQTQQHNQFNNMNQNQYLQPQKQYNNNNNQVNNNQQQNNQNYYNNQTVDNSNINNGFYNDNNDDIVGDDDFSVFDSDDAIPF